MPYQSYRIIGQSTWIRMARIVYTASATAPPETQFGWAWIYEGRIRAWFPE